MDLWEWEQNNMRKEKKRRKAKKELLGTQIMAILTWKFNKTFRRVSLEISQKV